MLGLCVYCLCLFPCGLAPCFSVPELLSLCLYLFFLHGILIIFFFFSKHVSDSVTLMCLLPGSEHEVSLCLSFSVSPSYLTSCSHPPPPPHLSEHSARLQPSPHTESPKPLPPPPGQLPFCTPGPQCLVAFWPWHLELGASGSLSCSSSLPRAGSPGAALFTAEAPSQISNQWEQAGGEEGSRIRGDGGGDREGAWEEEEEMERGRGSTGRGRR